MGIYYLHYPPPVSLYAPKGQDSSLGILLPQFGYRLPLGAEAAQSLKVIFGDSSLRLGSLRWRNIPLFVEKGGRGT